MANNNHVKLKINQLEKVPSPETGKLFCQTCKRWYSGVISYKEHLLTIRH